MDKLPIGDAVRFAYRFTFGQIGTIIGLIWIPMLIIVVGSYFTVQPYYGAMAVSARTGAAPAGGTVLIFMLFQVVALLLVASMMVSITQQALGLRKGLPLAHFALGMTELRVYGGIVGLFLLFVLFLLGYAMGFAAITIAAKFLAGYGMVGRVSGGVLATAYAVVGLCALFYVMVRLSFVFIPAAVTGTGFGLARSWEITKGHFWRIFAIGCATILPLAVVLTAAEVAILGPHFFVADFMAIADKAAQARNAAAQVAAMQENFPYLLGLSFVIAPVMYGLALAPAAFIWRFLAPPKA